MIQGWCLLLISARVGDTPWLFLSFVPEPYNPTLFLNNKMSVRNLTGSYWIVLRQTSTQE